MPSKPVIEIQNLNVTYFKGKSNEVHALKNVSLEINKGEFIIFFGPSGCGKSTLLYAIAGLERQVEGKIRVADQDIVGLTRKQFEIYHQKTTGMIFQAFYLIPSINVLQNVAMPMVAIGKMPKERNKKAQELLDHFGVGAQAKKLPTELSGGQQQRVAISRALINDPDIVFADEPVGNLDSKSAADVLELVQDLSFRQNRTVILVTHDPSHLDVADRVFFMKDGELIDVRKNETSREERRRMLAEHDSEKKDALDQKKVVKKEAETGLLLAPPKEEDQSLLRSYLVSQVVTEMLTGLSLEDVQRIERAAFQMFGEKVTESDVEAFLKMDIVQGGVGLHAQTAKRMARTLHGLVQDLKDGAKAFASKKNVSNVSVLAFRKALLERAGISVRSQKARTRLDATIRERLSDSIDSIEVYTRFDTPLEDGGVGLRKQHAAAMARWLELYAMSRFAGDWTKKPTEGASENESEKKPSEQPDQPPETVFQTKETSDRHFDVVHINNPVHKALHTVYSYTLKVPLMWYTQKNKKKKETQKNEKQVVQEVPKQKEKISSPLPQFPRLETKETSDRHFDVVHINNPVHKALHTVYSYTLKVPLAWYSKMGKKKDDEKNNTPKT